MKSDLTLQNETQSSRPTEGPNRISRVSVIDENGLEHGDKIESRHPDTWSHVLGLHPDHNTVDYPGVCHTQ